MIFGLSQVPCNMPCNPSIRVRVPVRVQYCTFAIIPSLAFPNFVCCARTCTVPFRNPERESCPVMCDTCIGYPYCASFASSLFFCFSYCCMVDYPQHWNLGTEGVHVKSWRARSGKKLVRRTVHDASHTPHRFSWSAELCGVYGNVLPTKVMRLWQRLQ